MEYFLSQFNKYKENPGRVFLIGCAVIILLGVLFLERNVCLVTEYIHQSRLAGSDFQTTFICRIF
jgi:hypothetical protein